VGRQPGYTQKMAARIKHNIDLDVARIEDRARLMRRRVGDLSVTTASVETALEDIREAAVTLKEIVDRRTHG
jgi:hypothetical protein